eukprot:GHVN01026662.1.p2 GENE.GHVN01026662.1~~GHVN01026662.1.p2  ORF type:complete len:125 (-),score=47.91 GHVN01026662.1:382-756(-)
MTSFESPNQINPPPHLISRVTFTPSLNSPITSWFNSSVSPSPTSLNINHLTGHHPPHSPSPFTSLFSSCLAFHTTHLYQKPTPHKRTRKTRPITSLTLEESSEPMVILRYRLTGSSSEAVESDE